MKPYTLLAAVLALGSLPAAVAGDLYLITNKLTALSENDARDVFLTRKTMSGSTPLLVVDNADLQKDFQTKVLHIDGAKYGKLWVNKSFRDGVNPPDVKASDAEVVAAVRATAGTIGYVSMLPPNVTLIAKY
ncbi:MAG: hypothetical protein ACEQSK_04075 [Sphingomonadaceae bacterium]